MKRIMVPPHGDGWTLIGKMEAFLLLLFFDKDFV